MVGYTNVEKIDCLDVILSLVDRKGNPSPAKLSVQITQGSTSTVAGDALEQAQRFAQKLSQPLVSNVSDAFTNMSDTLSNHKKLVISFNALMKRFEPLVTIADEVAKVRSSVSCSLHDVKSTFFKRSIPMSISRGKCFLQE